MQQSLLQILGLPNDSKSWPYSEETLLELIHLQKAKEITKQQYYKLENLKLSNLLIEKCERLGIPSEMIISIFIGGEEINLQDLQKIDQPSITRHTPLSPQRTTSVPVQRTLDPPVTFTSTSNRHMISPIFNNRPTSPAKLGAAAVAKLSKPTPIYKNPNNSHRHKRNQSLPIVTLQGPSLSPNKTMGSMMGIINPIQFINETPAKVIPINSSQKIGKKGSNKSTTTFLFESGLDYKPNSGHKRTRSFNESSSSKTNSSGPKFANDILQN